MTATAKTSTDTPKPNPADADHAPGLRFTGRRVLRGMLGVGLVMELLLVLFVLDVRQKAKIPPRMPADTRMMPPVTPPPPSANPATP